VLPISDILLLLLFCVPCLFELPTALLEYLDLLQRGCSPPALQVATPIWLWLWNIQYNGTAILLLVNPFILHRNNCTARPTYVFIVWKEDALLPAMFNLLCSRTNQQLFKKNFCNQSSHYENYRRFNESHHVPTTKSTLFMVNKDEWCTKEDRVKYVQRYSKRHLFGWSDIEQQARSLSYCWVMQVWRHQAVSQSVSRKFHW